MFVLNADKFDVRQFLKKADSVRRKRILYVSEATRLLCVEVQRDVDIQEGSVATECVPQVAAPAQTVTHYKGLTGNTKEGLLGNYVFIFMSQAISTFSANRRELIHLVSSPVSYYSNRSPFTYLH